MRLLLSTSSNRVAGKGVICSLRRLKLLKLGDYGVDSVSDLWKACQTYTSYPGVNVQ